MRPKVKSLYSYAILTFVHFCLVFVHDEPTGVNAHQTHPPGHQQDQLQLYAVQLPLADNPQTPQHLQGQAHRHHFLSTNIPRGQTLRNQIKPSDTILLTTKYSFDDLCFAGVGSEL